MSCSYSFAFVRMNGHRPYLGNRCQFGIVVNVPQFHESVRVVHVDVQKACVENPSLVFPHRSCDLNDRCHDQNQAQPGVHLLLRGERHVGEPQNPEKATQWRQEVVNRSEPSHFSDWFHFFPQICSHASGATKSVLLANKVSPRTINKPPKGVVRPGQLLFEI